MGLRFTQVPLLIRQSHNFVDGYAATVPTIPFS
jgi:hypothetical protein